MMAPTATAFPAAHRLPTSLLAPRAGGGPATPHRPCRAAIITGAAPRRSTPLRHQPAAAPRRRIPAAAEPFGGRAPADLTVCLGEGLYDYLADQKGLPRDQVTSWTPYPGGAPANVAAALATLGAPVAFVSALGRDARGDGMVALLAGKGVDVSGVQRVDAPTRDVYVVFDQAGERQFVGFGSPDPAAFADCALDAAALPAGLLARAGALVTGTLGLAYPKTAAAMAAAVDAARAGGAAVVVDVNWRPVFFDDPASAPSAVRPYVGRADVVKLADEEAEWLFGVPAPDALADPTRVLAALPASTAGVLVTAGGAGCSFAFRPAAGGGGDATPLVGRLPAAAVDVVDTTGAGDAFLAGFLYAMGAAGGLAALVGGGSRALREAVAFGAACGAATTTRPGAIDAQPSLAEAASLAAAVGAQWKAG